MQLYDVDVTYLFRDRSCIKPMEVYGSSVDDAEERARYKFGIKFRRPIKGVVVNFREELPHVHILREDQIKALAKKSQFQWGIWACEICGDDNEIHEWLVVNIEDGKVLDCDREGDA
ncbi:hypothetical protein ACFC1L_39890 [Streptomyces sp. NPDC056210]|uniref:hypothetical protein n=1 Tax=Streptomyces sp. NPDC056210 TaxID=3345746 RepID=UPI0035D808E1